MEKLHKMKSVWVEGPVSPAFIADSIAKHSSMQDIGAHSIFLGQVRRDRIGAQEVCAIEYSAYAEMADPVFHRIREDMFAKYQLNCLHVYHSLGTVAAGEICLFVFTSSPHRRDAIDACNELVERIKKEAPVWGKEIFAEGGHQWKQNLV
jgi:molybdopterin synthase catalytic subunit